ncbi:MAG TPA: HEAT repeat domain-containing protein, partial [Isosphaeraceae bacterium]|nr:HEAT repeat domain-containing protein [Isosphaeraceae bacterium]
MLQPITRACATHFWARLIVLATLVLCSQGNASAEVVSIAPGVTLERVLPKTNPDEVLSLLVSVRSGDLTRTERMRVSAQLSDGTTLSKSLHGGDPDLWLPIRATPGGTVRLSIQSSGSTRPHLVLIEATSIPVAASERHAIEAEPNNDWQQANPLLLGRDVYGSADDVDYLHNTNEGEEGLDWYRVELTEPNDSLVFFHLDLVDRDVSADLRLFTLNDHGGLEPFETGKDPMETIHNRERVRYSTHLSRVLSRGTYYLRVNANHPCYVLRTRRLAVPPYRDPRLAVDVGLHYLQNAGDAWFSQIPREGNRTVRSVSLHETATRCTACHAAAFPLDATLWAHRKGYPIRNRPGVQYLEDRLRASITPLPGFDDLGWQRFIATPLEAQGLQGGLVADFDRQIGGRPDPMFDRFVPFLRAAWSARTALPEDERNGVIPLDSKFELAWRDWQVLTEAARRQGDRESFEAARTIERLVADPASDLRIETLQDRLHRLLCWWMFDMEANSGRIFDESESILRLQNDDGGWHELDSRSGPSAVYTTGQVVWTLLQVGASRDDPRVAKALNYLLAAQQSFGGWFQAETHENFRTPMRETRFAVMALASAYPRGEPQPGWGGSGSLTQSNSIVEVLDDLEGLWDRPDSDPGSLEKAVSGLLNHPVPLVRAHAASCLGRIGSESAISPLVGSLDDPSKIVVRASAESLRRLGRSGMAGNLLVEALASRDPLTRRGAARVFEHPFPGLDNRLDLATRLLLLSDDPDLWTRLSVIRALRQWFYRSSDPALKRRIVYAFLSRMARETDPVVSRNLSQNLYIILDENLGGGVSLQKNLMALPDPLRERALTARENTEQQVLLGPILSALGSAEDRQRAAILASFDGSFFEGRTYARQPTNQIDVGNDREFGFLSEPPQRLLEDTFSSVFQRETRPIPLTQALTLAEFFRVPGRTSRREISTALIVALSSPEESVSRTAAEIVASSLSLHDLSEDPETLALLLKALDGPVPVRRALANALVRSPETLNQPEIRAKLERGLHR